MDSLNYNEDTGLIPAIVQDATTGTVLMLGYMDAASVAATRDSGTVTFFSRSKGRQWVKGETSGNYLRLVDMKADCDRDTLLIKAHPKGPTCHTGTDTCWAEENKPFGFISELESIISTRKELAASRQQDAQSYVASLFRNGTAKIAQKVGEEAVETVIEALGSEDELFLNESADLVFHLLILIQAKGYRLQDIIAVLEARHGTRR